MPSSSEASKSSKVEILLLEHDELININQKYYVIYYYYTQTGILLCE